MLKNGNEIDLERFRMEHGYGALGRSAYLISLSHDFGIYRIN